MARIDPGNIPYDPVPSVRPEGDIPSVHVQAEPEAFGVNIAHAIEGLGKVTEQVGNEMFGRAMAYQDMRNESDAINGDAKAAMAMNDLRTKYGEQRGKDADDGWNGFQNDLENTRKSIRDSLPNDAVRRQYDRTSLSTMSRVMFSGAEHRASEMRQYNHDANEAKIQSAVSEAETGDATDPRVFETSLAKIKEAVEANYKGSDPVTIQNATAKAQSAALLGRAKNWARTAPVDASKFVDNMIKEGRFYGTDGDKATQAVNQQVNTTAARLTSDNLTRGRPAYFGQNDNQTLDHVHDAVQQVVNGVGHAAGLDNRFKVEPGEPGGRSVKIVPDDPDQLASLNAAAQSVGEQLGIPVEVTENGMIKLPDDYDVSKTPKAAERTLKQKMDEGLAYADKLATPSNPDPRSWFAQRISSDHNRQMQLNRSANWQNNQTVFDAVNNIELNSQDHHVPTMEEVLQDPATAEAYYNLPPQDRHRWIDHLRTKKAAGTDDINEWWHYQGMPKAELADVEPLDVAKNEKLSVRSREAIMTAIKKARENPQDDPRLTRAMSFIQSDIPEALSDTPNKRNRIRGIVLDLLDDYAADHPDKRMMPEKEVREMGKRLIANEVTKAAQPGTPFLGFGVKATPEEHHAFVTEHYTPAEIQRARNLDVFKGLDYPPTDEQVERYLLRKEYHRRYGGKAGGAGPSVIGAPTGAVTPVLPANPPSPSPIIPPPTAAPPGVPNE